jgi:hypothetical protein
MPKTPKTQPKPKSKPNSKVKGKKQVEPEPVSITTKKWYWIMVSVFLAVFGGAYGYYTGLPTPAIVLMLAAVLSVVGFAAYIRIIHSDVSLRIRAASLVFGFSILGFGIWAIIVLSLYRLGLQTQIAYSIGDAFFALTSLIICLIVGAFIGDSIGKHFEALKAFFRALPGKIFGFKDKE